MEILFDAKKGFLRTLSSSTGCWGPCSQSAHTEGPFAPFSYLRKCQQLLGRALAEGVAKGNFSYGG